MTDDRAALDALAALEARGFSVRAADGKLFVAPGSALTAADRDAVARHRATWLAWFAAGMPGTAAFNHPVRDAGSVFPDLPTHPGRWVFGTRAPGIGMCPKWDRKKKGSHATAGYTPEMPE